MDNDHHFFIAIEMDCFHPEATKVTLIPGVKERQAWWLGPQFLVFEKLPGIERPFWLSYEERQRCLKEPA